MRTRYQVLLALALLVPVLALVFYDSIPGTLRQNDKGETLGTGQTQFRYKSGVIKGKEEYRRGKLVRSEWFDPKGQSILVTNWIDESGVGLYLREDGSIRVRMTYIKNRADGPATYYAKDGNVTGVAIYHAGVRVDGFDPSTLPKDDR